jgi:GNAT superfamily N-acetyltransferase
MLHIRQARSDDASVIVSFIRELALYEQAPLEAVKATDEKIREFGFGETPRFYCYIAEWDNVPVGFALYFYNFSTWEAAPGIYLEDLFVLPQYRKHGIGFALLKTLAQKAVEEQCTRLVWQVLDWNQLAIDFYESLGAVKMSEWFTYKMNKEAIQKLSEA